MAGGSADAAATLVALDRLWSLQTPDDDLLALAAELGSDVPFALVGGTARGTGRGEVVALLEDDSALWWVVVPDAAGLSTPAVYQEFDVAPGIGSGRPAPTWSDDYPTIVASLRNDLQDAALRLRPELAATRDALTEAGADAVLLSGSGPTFLGLTATRSDAHDVVDRLPERLVADVRIATGPVAGAHVVEYV
jgi:4-diphosphocytidyl-2-C-methyl-D-erythritol kinase